MGAGAGGARGRRVSRWLGGPERGPLGEGRSTEPRSGWRGGGAGGRWRGDHGRAWVAPEEGGPRAGGRGRGDHEGMARRSGGTSSGAGWDGCKAAGMAVCARAVTLGHVDALRELSGWGGRMGEAV